MSWKRKQGDSLWIDVELKDIEVADDVWPDWTGSWAIVTSLGATPTLSGAMIQDPVLRKFYARVGATEMSTLSVGNYIAVGQVENSTVDYRQEIFQEKLVITPQGIIP